MNYAITVVAKKCPRNLISNLSVKMNSICSRLKIVLVQLAAIKFPSIIVIALLE